MQSTITIILCAFLIFLSAQARSIVKIESGLESEMAKETDDKQRFSEEYSKLLMYLKDRQTNNYNEDDNDSSSNSAENLKQMPKRGFFLFPSRRSSQRYRPIYSYGRKSHWDTFFG